MSKNENVNFNKIVEELKGAGIVTQDQLNAQMQDMFKELQAKLPKSSNGEDDIYRHLNGECGNEECSIYKAGKEMYETGLKHGAFYGIKLGAYGAKRGVEI